MTTLMLLFEIFNATGYASYHDVLVHVSQKKILSVHLLHENSLHYLKHLPNVRLEMKY